MQKRLVRLFVRSAGVVFLTTALAKVLSALGNAPILNGPDPVFGLDIRTVLLVAAGIESIVGLVCLRGTWRRLQVGLVLWLSTTFVLYRIGLWLVKHDRPCPCLGTMTDALHISPQAADMAMKILLTYLLVGSYGTLFWLWRDKWKNRLAAAAANIGVSGEIR